MQEAFSFGGESFYKKFPSLHRNPSLLMSHLLWLFLNLFFHPSWLTQLVWKNTNEIVLKLGWAPTLIKTWGQLMFKRETLKALSATNNTSILNKSSCFLADLPAGAFCLPSPHLPPVTSLHSLLHLQQGQAGSKAGGDWAGHTWHIWGMASRLCQDERGSLILSSNLIFFI